MAKGIVVTAASQIDPWIGNLSDLSTAWAATWCRGSGRPWGEAWVHFAQSLAAAEVGWVGISARAEASGLNREQARTIEADWAAIHGVQWREDAPPVWDNPEGMAALRVPTPFLPWADLRKLWYRHMPGRRPTAAWGTLQWALRTIAMDQPQGTLFGTKDMTAQLQWRRNTILKAKRDLISLGLLKERQVTGLSAFLTWPLDGWAPLMHPSDSARPSITPRPEPCNDTPFAPLSPEVACPADSPARTGLTRAEEEASFLRLIQSVDQNPHLGGRLVWSAEGITYMKV